MSNQKQDEPRPLSEIYYVPKGFMVRLFTDGWHCTCFQPDCEHIEVAKGMHKEAKEGSKQ